MSIFNSLLAGAEGLEFETGTWTPTSDYTIRGEIPLNKVHAKPPAAYVVFDIGTDPGTTATNFFGAYVDFDALFGEVLVGVRIAHGVRAGIYRGSSSPGVLFTTKEITAGASNPDDSSTGHYRYYATETTLRPEVIYNAYWKNRTYKWIAIWT